VLLTVVVAMGVGWWLDRDVLARRLALRENRRSSMLFLLDDALKKEGFTITVSEYELAIVSPKGVTYSGGLFPPGRAAARFGDPSSPLP
jgi:hypothetical protein